jgi:small subunit ribosomal protein S7
MSRKQTNFTRDILPDPKFGSEMITRFINMVMVSGKKSVAEKIVYGAIETISEKNKSADPVDLVEKALDNVSPMVEVKSRRVGGATYQVPVEVRPKRRQTLAMRWIIDARASAARSPWPRLAGELLDAADSAAPPSRSAKTPTGWPKPTRLSRITAGKPRLNQQNSSRTSSRAP